MPERPPATAGMHHVALFVQAFDECVTFYTELLGMEVEWHPDADNVYLTSGSDNVAIHRASEPTAASAMGVRHTQRHLILDEFVQRGNWQTILAGILQTSLCRHADVLCDFLFGWLCARVEAQLVRALEHTARARRCFSRRWRPTLPSTRDPDRRFMHVLLLPTVLARLPSATCATATQPPQVQVRGWGRSSTTRRTEPRLRASTGPTSRVDAPPQ